MNIIASRSLTSFALAGTLLAGIGQAEAAVSIPVVAPLDYNQPLVDVVFSRDLPGLRDAARNTANSLMNLPWLGPIGYFDLDGGMWSWSDIWVHGDSMGTRATVGAWGNIYTDIAGHTNWWLHGHVVTAHAWVFRDPYYNPTMTCAGCASSPWRAEAFVEHVNTDGPVTRLWSANAPASIVRDVYDPISVPILHEDFTRSFPFIGTMRVQADASLGLTAQGRLSASLDGTVAELDGTADAGVSLNAYGQGPTVCPPWPISMWAPCTSTIAMAYATVGLLKNQVWDANYDGAVNEADVAGNPTPRAARVHTRVSLGERSLNLDDPAHPKGQICGRAEGDLWIANALKGDVSYYAAVFTTDQTLDHVNGYNQFGGLGLHPYASRRACAALAAPF